MSFKSFPSYNGDHPSLDDMQAFQDQVLDPLTTEAFQEHISSCPSCQKELSRLQSLAARLESLPEITLEKDFSPAIIAKIEENKTVPKGLTWTLLIEGIAAGVVLGLFIPAIRISVWTPRLLEFQFEIRAAINIFLTQIASSWILWWAKVQFDFTQITNGLNTSITLPTSLPSPWILILVGAAAGLLTNFFLLKSSYQFRKNGTNE